MHPPIHPPSSKKDIHKHQVKQQVSTSSSSYCAAAAAMKRSEDQSRPHFKDMPSILEPIPPDSNLWVIEEGTYLGAIVTNVPYIAQDFFLAPHAQIDDHQLCLIIFRGTMTRSNLLQTLLKIEKGEHVGIP